MSVETKVKDLMAKAKAKGKTQVYGKDTLTLGEVICFILAIVVLVWGGKLKIPDKYRTPVAMLIILLGMLIW